MEILELIIQYMNKINKAPCLLEIYNEKSTNEIIWYLGCASK